MTTLIGVDFSGSQADNATWIAMANVGDDGRIIRNCHIVRPDKLRVLTEMEG